MHHSLEFKRYPSESPVLCISSARRSLTCSSQAKKHTASGPLGTSANFAFRPCPPVQLRQHTHVTTGRDKLVDLYSTSCLAIALPPLRANPPLLCMAPETMSIRSSHRTPEAARRRLQLESHQHRHTDPALCPPPWRGQASAARLQVTTAHVTTDGARDHRRRM